MGHELYHFEIQELEGAQCQLTVYLKVWVIQPPLRGKHELITLALTAVVFWMFLLGLYLEFSFRQS
jgi:hypothetical protein